MLARFTSARQVSRVVFAPVRFKTSRVEGSVAQSKGFSKKEKAHEDEYIHVHEQELLRKMRDNIVKKKAELDALEKEHRELEKQANPKE